MMPRVPANRSVRILRSPFQLETSLPNIKAAEKWVRQSEKRELRNRDVKTRLKTLFKKAKNSGDAATAPKVESQLDKAAQKGIIHPNKAARKKSRLTKAIKVTAVAVAAAAAAPQTSRAARKKSGAKK
jgi:small subunit ribosomal protein S20